MGSYPQRNAKQSTDKGNNNIFHSNLDMYTQSHKFVLSFIFVFYGD